MRVGLIVETWDRAAGGAERRTAQSVTESLAMGRPCVATGQGAIAEAACGFAVPTNPSHGQALAPLDRPASPRAVATALPDRHAPIPAPVPPGRSPPGSPDRAAACPSVPAAHYPRPPAAIDSTR